MEVVYFFLMTTDTDTKPCDYEEVSLRVKYKIMYINTDTWYIVNFRIIVPHR